jgi:hypothetical protein
VTIDNLHNSAIKLAEAAGFKTPELFFSDPKQQPPQQPKPDPEMMKLQAEMQMEQQKTQMDFAMRQREAELKAEIEKVQAQADIATQQQKTEMELQLAQQKFALDRELKILEAQIKASQSEEDRAMRREDSLREDSRQPVAEAPKGPDQGAVITATALQALAASLEKMNAPKRLVRDPVTGAAMGVETA